MIIFSLMNQIKVIKDKNTSEIEQLLSTYLEEIKDENARLQRELMRVNNVNREIPSYEPHIKVHDEQDNLRVENIPTPNEYNNLEHIVNNNDVADVVETSIEARSLQLYNEGYSITEIAQKLNCGKTEVSLIIDLANREKINR